MSLHSDNVAFETKDAADLPHAPLQKGDYEITLRVVAMEQVVPHEHYHGRRVDGLMARLATEGKLINPPIVAQHGDKYVVLDGATRLTALRQMGYPSIIVQVVDLGQEQVQLTSWNHVVYGGSPAGFIELLAAVPGLRLTPVGADHSGGDEMAQGVVAHMMTADNQSYLLEPHPSPGTPADLIWLRLLNEVVARYGEWANVERTLSHDVTELAEQYSDLAGLMIFPRFSPQGILELADQGRTVPAGITRFLIPGRILRLNAPLEILAADQPLAVKQAWLDELVRAKVRGRQVRFYEEPVVLLDE